MLERLAAQALGPIELRYVRNQQVMCGAALRAEGHVLHARHVHAGAPRRAGVGPHRTAVRTQPAGDVRRCAAGRAACAACARHLHAGTPHRARAAPYRAAVCTQPAGDMRRGAAGQAARAVRARHVYAGAEI
ncbi:unnamed protein product [Parnassius apollo]|uniref:(apollo) hypothetical protein n=1 Tax=Parnassius apollo TaxID=110799 RepID=A0A8S3WZ06_PARAO|nr:unnamed protein product [Parnassius apollo]